MHSRTLKFVLPAAVAAAVVAAVGFWPSGKGRGVVLAEVVQRLRSAHTVTCRLSGYAKDKLAGTADYMFMGDHLTRVALSDGLVYISDGAAGRGLILDTRKKTAAFVEETPHRFDFYKAVTEFRNGTETPLGRKQIDGRDAVGFLLPYGNGRTSLWVDTQSGLPLRLEAKATGPNGVEQTMIVTAFVLDAPLDESLFSLTMPDGYSEGPVRVSEIDEKLAGREPEGQAARQGERTYVSAADRAKEMALRLRSATALRQLVLACLQYAGDHNGQWPGDLQALAAYGIDAAALVNPRRPDNASGWVYRRPTGQLRNPPQTAVIHEELEPWNEGAHVAFADGHIEFIKDRERLNKLLGR